jgi:hypothetical protein
MHLLSTVSMFWQSIPMSGEIEVVCHVAAFIPRGISLYQYVQIVCECHVSSPNISVDKSPEPRGSTFHVAIPTIPSFFIFSYPNATWHDTPRGNW